MAFLRNAQAADDRAIKRIIHQAHINPMSLDWRHFVVAVQDGHVVGVGQIKTHFDGSRELASIAVVPEWQHAGIASALIHRLIEGEKSTLFLTCRRELEGFYERFGFRRVGASEMTPYFRRIDRLGRLIGYLVPRGRGLAIMRRG